MAYVSAAEAARQAGVSERTVRCWATSGRVRSIKRGHGYRAARAVVAPLAGRLGGRVGHGGHMTRYGLPASMALGAAGALCAALAPFGWDAWTRADLLLSLVAMAVLLAPAGAAVGLVCALALWTVLSLPPGRGRSAISSGPSGPPRVPQNRARTRI
jgi:hypothetical protein